MRLGVMLGYFGAGTTAAEQLEAAQEAERAGYDSAWVAEAYGSDAATVLAWLAAQTSTIKLGSAVPARPWPVRASGGRGLARPAVRPAACSDPRLPDRGPDGPGAPPGRLPGPDPGAAPARRAGQGPQAHHRPGPAAAAHLPGGDGAGQPGHGRGAGRWLARVPVRARARRHLP